MYENVTTGPSHVGEGRSFGREHLLCVLRYFLLGETVCWA